MLLIAFVGGMLTILSPCILPVVPLLFTGAHRPRGFILLTLAGMAATFAFVSTLAVASSAWVTHANDTGRLVALAVMAVFALSLIFTRVSHALTRPFVALGNRLDARSGKRAGPVGALALGAATGLLWAPCAGPILGVILTGAMLQGPNAHTTLLLLAYGAGSALSLGALIFAGRGLVNRIKPSLGATAWLRRGAGVAVLLAAVLIGSGADKTLLAATSSAGGAALEQGVLSRAPKAIDALLGNARAAPASLDRQGAMPALSGAVAWLNSPALSADALRGKVVLVDFWTYDCINCQHTLPHVNAWATQYADQGLVVIGVHTPEYPYEKIIANVREQVRKLGIGYPVAIDNDYALWKAFGNQYWPAHYLFDAQGQLRYTHVGEGDYAEQEQAIQALLRERDPVGVGGAMGSQARASSS
ncbi:cytochrome c biogenesis protein DipZ [Pseudomonas sp. RIT-PI-S]|uniref:cytochrome c biogenesis protein DipZ n=1 Tax=Pseudomonas sp. RIT-PI-S TaxID=3035295 RepID=UPI0021D8E7A2|nr:cytochrome c biogenesis protein DipZ [Pseudomonas sp. RIT-PI-S]